MLPTHIIDDRGGFLFEDIANQIWKEDLINEIQEKAKRFGINLWGNSKSEKYITTNIRISTNKDKIEHYKKYFDSINSIENRNIRRYLRNQ